MKKGKNFFTTLSDALSKVVVWIITVLTICLTAVVFLQVVFRYVFSYSFLWGEEASILCFTWIVFLGTGIGIKEGTHFIVDIFPDSMPEKWNKLLRIVTSLLTIIAAIVLIVFGISFAESGLTRYSYSTGIPMIVIYVVGPIAGVLTLIFALENMFGAKEDKKESD